MSKIVVVVPTCRPESIAKFKEAWKELFTKHNVTLVIVWDGEHPEITWEDYTPFEDDGLEPKRKFKSSGSMSHVLSWGWLDKYKDVFCRYTDACRNIGFVQAAKLGADYILTLDDDVLPNHNDPIQEHLDILGKEVMIQWMNTSMDRCSLVCYKCRKPPTNRSLSGMDFDCEYCGCSKPVTVNYTQCDYLRGVPYQIRNEAPVMLSHGVWVGTPDFDGETQLKLEGQGGIPYTLPYYVGPIPKGVLFPLCGMSVMVRKEALPYLYFAPMGPDSGVKGLNRFSDIFMGIYLKREFDRLGWAVYTGGSTILHSRASDAKKNFEQEKLGREWNEVIWDQRGDEPKDLDAYFKYKNSYENKRERYKDLIISIQKEQPK